MNSGRRKIVVKWLEMLANGLDPISGDVIGQDSILLNQEIAEALEYATNELRHIDEKEQDAHLAASAISGVDLPEMREAVTVSELCIMIDAIAKEKKCHSVQPRQITRWLVGNGFLVECNDEDGYSYKKATARGEEIGIKSEARIGAIGSSYCVNYYNSDACKYIIGNLEECYKY